MRGRTDDLQSACYCFIKCDMILASGRQPSKVDEGQRMVKTRHRSSKALRDRTIESVPFVNRRHPGLDMEVMSLAELHGRMPMHHRHLYTRPVFHQLILTESGVVEHEVDFERYRCSAGTVLHLRPGQVQKFGRETDAQGWLVLFLPEFLPPEPLLETRLGPSDAVAITPTKKQLRSLTTTLHALVSTYETVDGQACTIHALQHLLLALLLHVTRAYDAAQDRKLIGASGMLHIYRRFLQEVEQHFSSNRDATYYASRLGCSVKTLERACKTVAGATPKRLIERRVTLEAKRLLAHSSLSVSAIGVELGFSEATNFVKFFRRSVEMTPSAFREGRASSGQ